MLHSRKSLDIILADIEHQVKHDLDISERRTAATSELHQCVPEKLKQRLVKLLPQTLFDGDDVFEEDKTKMKTIEPDLQAEIKRHLPHLNDILDEKDVSVDCALELMSRGYKEMRLRSDNTTTTSRHRFKERQVNWIAAYAQKLKRHRVQWNSKLYRDNAAKNWANKSMIENSKKSRGLSHSYL